MTLAKLIILIVGLIRLYIFITWHSFQFLYFCWDCNSLMIKYFVNIFRRWRIFVLSLSLLNRSPLTLHPLDKFCSESLKLYVDGHLLRYHWICMCISADRRFKKYWSSQSKHHTFNFLLVRCIGMFNLKYWSTIRFVII